MNDLITVTGVVGSDPRAIVAGEELRITSFRLASSRRYFNRATGGWEDAGTNWYTVSAFRQLGFNANASLRKGEHVVVHGRLKQRPWQAGDKAGVAIEIEADAIGHDLSWGMTQLQRVEARRDGASAHPAVGANSGITDSGGSARVDADRAGGTGGTDEVDEVDGGDETDGADHTGDLAGSAGDDVGAAAPDDDGAPDDDAEVGEETEGSQAFASALAGFGR